MFYVTTTIHGNRIRPGQARQNVAGTWPDFARVGEVFATATVTLEDIRRDYGETRYISVGLLDLRAVILVWTPRGKARRIISMRYANDREKEKYSKHLD